MTVTEEVLTVQGAAQLLGFNPWTIRAHARSGIIPGRKVGREWRFSRRQLLSWLEGRGEPNVAGFYTTSTNTAEYWAQPKEDE